MKFRITRVMTVEYEPVPEHYSDDATIPAPEEMLQIDIKGAQDDPLLFWEDEAVEVTVTGEIIHEEEN